MIIMKLNLKKCLEDKMAKSKEELIEELKETIENARDFHSSSEGCGFDNRDCSVMYDYNKMLDLIQEIQEVQR